MNRIIHDNLVDFYKLAELKTNDGYGVEVLEYLKTAMHDLSYLQKQEDFEIPDVEDDDPYCFLLEQESEELVNQQNAERWII